MSIGPEDSQVGLQLPPSYWYAIELGSAGKDYAGSLGGIDYMAIGNEVSAFDEDAAATGFSGLNVSDCR